MKNLTISFAPVWFGQLHNNIAYTFTHVFDTYKDALVGIASLGVILYPTNEDSASFALHCDNGTMCYFKAYPSQGITYNKRVYTAADIAQYALQLHDNVCYQPITPAAILDACGMCDVVYKGNMYTPSDIKEMRDYLETALRIKTVDSNATILLFDHYYPGNLRAWEMGK